MPCTLGGVSRWRDWQIDFLAKPHNEQTRALAAQVQAAQPGFVEAVVADARMAAANRGERFEYRSSLDTVLQVVRLAFATDAFLAQICYRARVSARRRGIPVLPWILHRVAFRQGGILIDDHVIVHAGVFLPHGRVQIAGITEIESRVMIGPFSTIGLVAGNFVGPTIRQGAKIGTGARVLGPVEIGAATEVGANAVVVRDLPADVVAVGIPAKVVRDKTAS